MNNVNIEKIIETLISGSPIKSIVVLIKSFFVKEMPNDMFYTLLIEIFSVRRFFGKSLGSLIYNWILIIIGFIIGLAIILAKPALRFIQAVLSPALYQKPSLYRFYRCV